MANEKTAVVGIYSTRESVERAIDTLVESGFRNSDISVLLPENLAAKAIGAEESTKAPEGAAAGVVLGGTLGLMVGIGALAIPAVAPLIAAEPIMAALTGVGVGGAVGGVTGALIGMGLPEYEAKCYEGHLRNGGILLSAHCDTPDETRRAREILKRTGAEDISSTGEDSVDSKKGEITRAANR